MHEPVFEAVFQRVLSQDMIHAGLGAVGLARIDVPLVDSGLQIIFEGEHRVGVGDLQLAHEALG